jgi:hypothetical protein
MLQLGSHPDLALEALGAQGHGQLGVEHLQRHRALVLDVARQVNSRHAAATELALDHIAARQVLLQLRK